MYKKFRLKKFEEEFKKNDKSIYNRYLEKGKVIYKDKEQIKNVLREFLNYEGELEANKIIEEWFRSGEYDIFLSHSHKDEELAIAIAGMLNEKFGLKVFIDSQVWGYIYDLQKEIDDEYCKNEGEKNSYSYNKRNVSTSHVHLMLSNALRKMIDSCDFFFFLDSQNSLKYVNINSEDATFSPWINLEVEITNTIRIKKIKETKIFDESYGVGNEALGVSFIYRPEFYNFILLKYEDIKSARNKKEFLEKLI
jgi:hypothetical protein